MPPRQYVPSTCAGHTRSCRSGADPADQQLRLDGARAVHDDDPAGVVGGHRRHGPRLGRGARPGAERVAEHGVQVDAGEVADDHGGGRGGAYVLLVEGAYGRGVDGRDGLLGALARAATCARSAGNSSLESSLAARREGLASSCGISSRRLLTSRSTSLSAKAGALQGVGEQAQRLGEPGGGHLQAEPDAGVVGVRVEGGAAALQFGGELLRGVLVRALGEGARHDRGHTVEAGRLGLQGGVQEHLHGDDLLAGTVAAQHRQAVVERAALGGREGPRPGVARLRPGVEVHRGELGHLAASSFSSVARRRCLGRPRSRTGS